MPPPAAHRPPRTYYSFVVRTHIEPCVKYFFLEQRSGTSKRRHHYCFSKFPPQPRSTCSLFHQTSASTLSVLTLYLLASPQPRRVDSTTLQKRSLVVRTSRTARFLRRLIPHRTANRPISSSLRKIVTTSPPRLSPDLHFTNILPPQ